VNSRELTSSARLRVVTVPALDGNDAAVRTAMAHLARVCAVSAEASLAWERLYRDAHAIMARRGSRTRSDIVRVLRSGNIRLHADPRGGPAEILSELCERTLRTTAEFSIIGVRKPLLVDEAWLPLAVLVRERPSEADGGDIATAIARYHSGPQRREQKSFDPKTLGRFRRHMVIVGGAGAGKTTLLKKLARVYAKDNLPVLRVSALAVARRMISSGEGFATAAFAIGLDESGVAPEQARGAYLGDWVILCDGLDECGPDQQRLAEGLAHFVAGQPNLRAIVTTRSIGYWTAALTGWRHYDLGAVENFSSTAESITKFLSHILPAGQKADELRRIVDEALEESNAAQTAARSPLLLGLCAALISREVSLGQTRLQFYRAVFALLEAEPPPRAGTAPASSAVLGRFLDILGWTLLTNARTRAETALRACAEVLQPELEIPALKAMDLSERCFAYWQALGIVERVHYAGDEALTFIHKTFAEFAAGRFMAALPTSKQSEILATENNVAGLSEAIAFASALGAGPVFVDDLLNRGFEGAIGQARLLQALEILCEADPPIDVRRVEALVDVAVSRLAGNHRTWALEASAALMRVATCYSTLVAPIVRPLRSASEQNWTSLGAWAVMLVAEPNELSLERLLATMDSLVEDDRGDAKLALAGARDLADRQGRVLLESFAYGIAERIVSERAVRPRKSSCLDLRLLSTGEASAFIGGCPRWVVSTVSKLRTRASKVWRQCRIGISRSSDPPSNVLSPPL